MGRTIDLLLAPTAQAGGFDVQRDFTNANAHARTPDVIGVLVVTESRVSQLHTKAVPRLKAHLSGGRREPAVT